MAIASILIDSREPTHIQHLTFGGVPTSVCLLDAGDLLVSTEAGELLAVERKQVSDLLNTLRDDRLFPQLVRLRELTPWAYLAICGSLLPGADGLTYRDGVASGWTWAAVDGALLTVQEIGVHILHAPSDADFEAAIIRLSNRDRTPLRVAPAREATMISDAEAILVALPGIGPEKAKALLAYAGTPTMALQYLTDDTFTGPSAPGLGPGTKRRIRRALELENWAMLAKIDKNSGNLRTEEKEKVTA